MAVPNHNIHSALAPLFYCGKIFGLCPFRIEPSGYGESAANKIYSCILLIVFVATFLYTLIQDYNILDQGSLITQVPQWLNLLLNPSCVICYQFFQIYYSKRLVTILTELDVFDRQTNKFFKIDLDKYYKTTKLTIMIITSILIVHLTISLILTVVVNGNYISFLAFFVVLIQYFLPQVANSFMCLQCCFMILFLKHRFIRLNNKLSKFILSAKNYPEVQNERVNDIGSRIVEEVRKRHLQMCLLTESLGEIYSPQILFMVLKSFIIITTGLYINGRLLMYYGAIPFGYAVYSLIQLGLSALQTIALTTICSSTRIEATKTRALLYGTTVHMKGDASFFRTQVNVAALQMMHVSVKITACDIVAIDQVLLLTIAGSVFTYLIVAIQFQIGDFPLNLT